MCVYQASSIFHIFHRVNCNQTWHKVFLGLGNSSLWNKGTGNSSFFMEIFRKNLENHNSTICQIENHKGSICKHPISQDIIFAWIHWCLYSRDITFVNHYVLLKSSMGRSLLTGTQFSWMASLARLRVNNVLTIKMLFMVIKIPIRSKCGTTTGVSNFTLIVPDLWMNAVTKVSIVAHWPHGCVTCKKEIIRKGKFVLLQIRWPFSQCLCNLCYCRWVTALEDLPAHFAQGLTWLLVKEKRKGDALFWKIVYFAFLVF